MCFLSLHVLLALSSSVLFLKLSSVDRFEPYNFKSNCTAEIFSPTTRSLIRVIVNNLNSYTHLRFNVMLISVEKPALQYTNTKQTFGFCKHFILTSLNSEA